MFNTRFDWIARWAKYTPNRLMLREYDTGLEWSYSDFNNRVNNFANYLRDELKIEKGDRVAVYSKNRAEYVLFFFACVKIGAILVPLNFRLTPRELDTLIKDAEPKLFIYEIEFENEVKKIQTLKAIPLKEKVGNLSRFLKDKLVDVAFTYDHEIIESDPVMILYTAGTTGLSKGASGLASRGFKQHTSPGSFGAPAVGVAVRYFKGDGGKTRGRKTCLSSP